MNSCLLTDFSWQLTETETESGFKRKTVTTIYMWTYSICRWMWCYMTRKTSVISSSLNTLVVISLLWWHLLGLQAYTVQARPARSASPFLFWAPDVPVWICLTSSAAFNTHSHIPTFVPHPCTFSPLMQLRFTSHIYPLCRKFGHLK